MLGEEGEQRKKFVEEIKLTIDGGIIAGSESKARK